MALGDVLRRFAGRLVRRPRRGLRVGHRDYVGGMWEEIGRLQFDFLVSEGLRPSDVLVDIACGSLRAGVHLIPFLEPGHYLGIEREASLVEEGLRNELAPGVVDERRPEFVVSDSFEFERFTRRANRALAHSLFTHLVPDDIMLCLTRLRRWCEPGCVLHATFFETAAPVENPQRSDPHLPFAYTRDEMRGFGAHAGWSFDHIGEWSHPRGQIMVRYEAPETPAEATTGDLA